MPKFLSYLIMKAKYLFYVLFFVITLSCNKQLNEIDINESVEVHLTNFQKNFPEEFSHLK